ncbi:hypothetical protein HDA32_001078 [Spinactinospora alkalitolerans]|uniref:TPM domain-containing protein n=1 Tax=Spinactinospora alkalitolerans TaxID=687207 RepID=A0A852TPS1_9ACTN|nr:hypothetical protein [Spinactinospora alkalitolerans]NYE45958.1 hypothetical protein [Spinactinospora alkalitolerans]
MGSALRSVLVVAMAALVLTGGAFPGGAGAASADELATISGDAAVEAVRDAGAAAQRGEPYVHPAVGEAFAVDADAVDREFGDLSEVRVAVLPDVRIHPRTIAEALLEPVGDEGVAVVYLWRGTGFRLHLESGSEGPDADTVMNVLHGPAGPDELIQRIDALAALINGGVISGAAEALATRPLHVAPGLSTDIDRAEMTRLTRAFGHLPQPVRVAVLPAAAAEYEHEFGRSGIGSIAELVRGERDVPVIVYTVSADGRIAAAVTSESRADDSGQRIALTDAAGSARDPLSAHTTLTNLLVELGDDSLIDAAAARIGDSPWYFAPLGVLVVVGVLIVLPGWRRPDRDDSPQGT